MPGRARSRLHGRTATQHDQVRQRHLLAALLRPVEGPLHAFQRRQHLGQFGRLVDLPALLRRQADARPIGAAALVGVAEGRCRGPGGGDQLRYRKPRAEDRGFQRDNVGRVGHRVRHRRDRVLPEQLLGRHQRAKAAGARPHVAAHQLVPGAGEAVGEQLRVLLVALRDWAVDRVQLQRHVGCGHHRRVAPARVMGVRHGALGLRVLRRPLPGVGRAFGQLPVVVQQVVQVVAVPLHRVGGPGPLDAAGDGVAALAGAEGVAPAQALLLDARGFRLSAEMAFRRCAMALAEGVPASHQRDGLLIVHRHPREGLADVTGGRDGVGGAVRPLRVDVDQTHLHGAQRSFEHPVAGVAIIAKPGGFGAPIDVLLRLPQIGAAAGEAEGLEAHGVQSAVAGEDDQVRPGKPLAVLLLDRPQQPARLVEIGIIRPAVQRREALSASGGAATAICDAVSAGAVPSHADEEGAIMAVIGGPPILRGGHQGDQVALQRGQVQLPERLGVVEPGPHRVRLGAMLMQDPEVELIRPPVPV